MPISGVGGGQPYQPTGPGSPDPTDVRKRIDEINKRIDEIDKRLSDLGIPADAGFQEYTNLINERGNLESELTDLISRGQNDQLLP